MFDRAARNCAIAYDEAWLANPERFNVSADLQLTLGYQPQRPLRHEIRFSWCDRGHGAGRLGPACHRP